MGALIVTPLAVHVSGLLSTNVEPLNVAALTSVGSSFTANTCTVKLLAVPDMAVEPPLVVTSSVARVSATSTPLTEKLPA